MSYIRDFMVHSVCQVIGTELTIFQLMPYALNMTLDIFVWTPDELMSLSNWIPQSQPANQHFTNTDTIVSSLYMIVYTHDNMLYIYIMLTVYIYLICSWLWNVNMYYCIIYSLTIVHEKVWKVFETVIYIMGTFVIVLDKGLKPRWHSAII